jgi:ATP-dependent DNA helicase RecG
MNLQTLKIKKRAGDTMPFHHDHYIEASHVDYKERLEEKKPRSWLKSVSAFANTEGGHLIFGVKNEPREVVGLENPQAVVSRLTELIKVRIDPTPRYRVREVEIDGKSCVDLEVQDGPAYPYYYAFDGSHTAYVRHGDQSEEATSRELNELILQGMNQTFDALPSSYRVGDVSFTLLAATFKNLKKEDFDLEKDLPSAGLVTDNGQITNGGLLLCDQGVLKQSRIFCTRWKGNYKGSIEEDALDDKEFQGASLITLLQNAEDFVRNNSKNPWSIRGMTREERSDYPYKAVREVLVNALIHRNYQILGSEIHVEVFDDRLEITSPGGMMNGRRVQDMDIRHIPSMRRNQVISDVFSRLGFMERRGSGIDRILNSYVEVAQKPTFYSDSDFFIVTLPNRSVATPAQVSMESVASGAESAEISAESAETSTVLHGMSTDAEVSELCERLNGTRLTASTKERTLELFKRYRYQYQFRSINVAQLYGVQKSRASSIIKNLIKHGLVMSPEYGVYQFVKK